MPRPQLQDTLALFGVILAISVMVLITAIFEPASQPESSPAEDTPSSKPAVLAGGERGNS